jgi:tellurite resistance protein TehA-like permease
MPFQAILSQATGTQTQNMAPSTTSPQVTIPEPLVAPNQSTSISATVNQTQTTTGLTTTDALLLGLLVLLIVFTIVMFIGRPKGKVDDNEINPS